MADLTSVQRDTINENAAYHPMWRVVDSAGDIYQNADITSCKYDAVQINNGADDTSLADDTALSLSASDSTPTTSQIGWYDTLQTGNGWDTAKDADGWNCIAYFPGTLFATPGTVRIEVYVVLAGDSSSVRIATFELTVIEASGA